MRKHLLYTQADLKDEPEDSALRRYVDGGLGICKVCGLGEGSLTTECPGEQSGEMGEAVYEGKLDYVEGSWQPKLNPTNRMWAALAERDAQRAS